MVSQYRKAYFLLNLIKKKDRHSEFGAALIRKSSSNTNDFAGDGTTTSTILTGEMVRFFI